MIQAFERRGEHGLQTAEVTAGGTDALQENEEEPRATAKQVQTTCESRGASPMAYKEALINGSARADSATYQTGWSASALLVFFLFHLPLLLRVFRPVENVKAALGMRSTAGCGEDWPAGHSLTSTNKRHRSLNGTAKTGI